LTFDMSRPTKALLSIISVLGEKHPFSYILDLFRGSNKKQIQTNQHKTIQGYAAGNMFSEEEARKLLVKLILEGYLKEEWIGTGRTNTPSSKLKLNAEKCSGILLGLQKFELKFHREYDDLGRPKLQRVSIKNCKRKPQPEESSLSQAEDEDDENQENDEEKHRNPTKQQGSPNKDKQGQRKNKKARKSKIEKQSRLTTSSGSERDERIVQWNKNDKFIVECIRSKRVKSGRTEYLLKWDGWSESFNEWQDEEILMEDCPELIKSFNKSAHGVESEPIVIEDD